MHWKCDVIITSAGHNAGWESICFCRHSSSGGWVLQSWVRQKSLGCFSSFLNNAAFWEVTAYESLLLLDEHTRLNFQVIIWLGVPGFVSHFSLNQDPYPQVSSNWSNVNVSLDKSVWHDFLSPSITAITATWGAQSRNTFSMQKASSFMSWIASERKTYHQWFPSPRPWSDPSLWINCYQVADKKITTYDNFFHL